MARICSIAHQNHQLTWTRLKHTKPCMHRKVMWMIALVIYNSLSLAPSPLLYLYWSFALLKFPNDITYIPREVKAEDVKVINNIVSCLYFSAIWLHISLSCIYVSVHLLVFIFFNGAPIWLGRVIFVYLFVLSGRAWYMLFISYSYADWSRLAI